jgi:WD40 repeat protein/uncharacterized caspase-like protein
MNNRAKEKRFLDGINGINRIKNIQKINPVNLVNPVKNFLFLLATTLCVVTAFLVLVSSLAFAESGDAPILKLDTGGHMALINKIIAMKDGRWIISASDDKTIRIWDAETGQETIKILGQIGGGAEGMIYAIALIPDKSIQGQVPDKLVPASSKQGSIQGQVPDKLVPRIEYGAGSASSKQGNIQRLAPAEAGGQAPDRLVPADSKQGWLAVGGFMETRWGKEYNYIRIYDMKTGTLIKVLKSHESVVLDLSVSSDGRYLVSGSADTTVKVWDIEDNFSLVHTFKGHTNYVYAVRIFKSGGDNNPLNPPLLRGTDKGDYKIVSAGDDNKVILWSLRDKEILNSYTHNNNLNFLAVSEKYIAVSGPFDNKINIFDLNLKRIKEIGSETIPAGLSFSPDGRLLLAGTGDSPFVTNIYDSHEGFRKITSFNKHDNTTQATAFLDNRTAVTGGGANNDIYIWDAWTGEVQRQITGKGKRVWSVGIRGLPSSASIGGLPSNASLPTVRRDKSIGGLPSNASIGGLEIAFGNTGLSVKEVHEHTGKLEKLINLETYVVNRVGAEGFKRIGTVYQGYSLTHAPGGEYGYEDAVLLIKKDGNETARVTRGSADGYRHRTYGWTGDGHIISGGSNGHLSAYNKQGQKTASFIGHTGEVWGIAIDGDTLVSGSDDQTIKLWDIRELKNLKPPSIDYEKLKQTAEDWAKQQPDQKWTTESVKNHLDSEGRSSSYMKAPEIKPIVSIFIPDRDIQGQVPDRDIQGQVGEDEWVVWSEEGFYNASTKGDQYVGWHVNKGPENSADYYSARQFRRYLYRPDIIRKTIELGSSSLAIEELAKKEPGIKDITVAELIKRAPVDVKIASVDIANGGKADVKVRLGKNTTTAPERITLYINGAQALTETERELKGAAPGDILKYTVNIPERKNHIKVTVENQWAENSHETTVDNPTGADRVSAKDAALYVVAVGISHYPELPIGQQLKSPPLDAKSIAEQLQKLEGTLYKKVDIKILTDDKFPIEAFGDKNTVITSDMVEKALREQTEKAGALDTTIIFIAGHGVTDAQGSYHLVTADTKITDAWGEQLNLKQGTSLDWKRLHSILDKAMGRRVVIVDTCQAGEVFSDNKTDIKRLVKDIHDVNAIVYSGTSRQDAGVETSKGGVFTLSMVSGFDGKASYDGNVLPFTRLRDYVDKEVPRLNRDIMLGLYRAVKIKQKEEKEVNFDSVQKPVAVMPNGMERFIIYAR